MHNDPIVFYEEFIYNTKRLRLYEDNPCAFDDSESE
jgi:hypothetical protein